MSPTEDPRPDLDVRAGYAAWASTYDDDGNPLTDLEGRAIRSRIGDLSGCRAIDLGCGTGRHTLSLIDAGADWVAALDPTPEMLSRARDRLAGRPIGWVRHALPGPIPFAEKTFALAVLGLVIEHIAALGPSLAEVARVLRPGGRCLISVLHPDRTAEGQRARFIDPASGLRRSIVTHHRTLAEYRTAASSVGLILDTEDDLVVPIGTGQRLPRALPYEGRRLGWLGVWSKPLAGFLNDPPRPGDWHG